MKREHKKKMAKKREKEVERKKKLKEGKRT